MEQIKFSRAWVFSFLALSSFASSGCNGIDGKNGGAADEPVGKFTLTGALPSSDTSRFTVGCKTVGQDTSLPQIDSRLQPEMIFEVSMKQTDKDGNRVVIGLKNEVQSANASTQVDTVTLTKAEGLAGLAAGFSMTATYTLENDGSLSSVYSPTPPSISLPSDACELKNVSGAATQLKFSGTFVTANGETFNAQKLIDRTEGEIFCNGASLGAGSMDSTLIVSNEVPSDGSAQFCGGVALFAAFTLKLADSSVIVDSTTEITSAR